MHIYIDVFVCVYIYTSQYQTNRGLLPSALSVPCTCSRTLSTKAKSVTDQQNMGIKPRIGEFLPDPTLQDSSIYLSHIISRSKQINDHTHIYIQLNQVTTFTCPSSSRKGKRVAISTLPTRQSRSRCYKLAIISRCMLVAVVHRRRRLGKSDQQAGHIVGYYTPMNTPHPFTSF